MFLVIVEGEGMVRKVYTNCFSMSTKRLTEGTSRFLHAYRIEMLMNEPIREMKLFLDCLRLTYIVIQ